MSHNRTDYQKAVQARSLNGLFTGMLSADEYKLIEEGFLKKEYSGFAGLLGASKVICTDKTTRLVNVE